MSAYHSHVLAYDHAVDVKEKGKKTTTEARFRLRRFLFTLTFGAKVKKEERETIAERVNNLISHKIDGVLFVSDADSEAKGKKNLFSLHMKARSKTHDVKVKKGDSAVDHMTTKYLRSLVSDDEIEACCIIDDITDEKKKKKTPSLLAPSISVEESMMRVDGKKMTPPKEDYHVITVKL